MSYAPTTPPREISEWIVSELAKVGDATNELLQRIYRRLTVYVYDGEVRQMTGQSRYMVFGNSTVILPERSTGGYDVEVFKIENTGQTQVQIDSDQLADGWTWEDGSTGPDTLNTTGVKRYISVTQQKIWLRL